MTEIEIIDDIPQGTPEWRMLHVGVPTASDFGAVIAAGEGKVRDLYMRKLAGELVSGLPREDYHNSAMDRGTLVEPELRAQYAMLADVDPHQVGFVRRQRPYGVIGCSPDSLIGTDGGCEIKSAAPHILIEILRSNRIPAEHLPQVHGSMLCSGRKWWDLAIGYPGMPMFWRRIHRNESYIARLEVGLQVFIEELNAMVKWLRSYRGNE